MERLTHEVLFVSDARETRGSETYLREVLPRLRIAGLDVAAAFPEAQGNERVRMALADQGVPVLTYANLRSLTVAARITILQCYRSSTYAEALSDLSGPLGTIIHDQLYVRHPLPWVETLNRERYLRFFAPWLRKLSLVITVSHWAARELEQSFGVPDVVSVPNGVDVERFRPASPEERRTLREKLGFMGYDVVVPGKIGYEKNQLAVVLAAHRLPDVTFHMLGSGDIEPMLRAIAPKNVLWLGYQPMPERILQAADAMCLMTRGENQSLATLEAMAVGLPVVTSTIPAQRELIRDGETGLTVDDTVEGIQRIKNDPVLAAQLGSAARAEVLAHHRIEQTVNRLLDVLSPWR